MEKTVEFKQKQELDARAIALIVQKANAFTSTIYLHCGDSQVNAKSIMGMMSLNIADGVKIKIAAEGEDAKAAVKALENFLSDGEICGE